ncbi:hypothetical protein [Okeania sp. SIO2B3]|uniref:hypothetical protein n=1 Tax=Okeania sp. SIO2B3 TaxID=2607784 RepID=UPI0013C14F8C|nr:hypothetical protein [Okeania sp. SIO2B3]NET41346.1 hypothetical protein [Okeania sp. SIO2B3]
MERIIGVGKLRYDINLNYLGVNPPLTPPNPPLTPPRRGGEDRVRRKERRRNKE